MTACPNCTPTLLGVVELRRLSPWQFALPLSLMWKPLEVYRDGASASPLTLYVVGESEYVLLPSADGPVMSFFVHQTGFNLDPHRIFARVKNEVKP